VVGAPRPAGTSAAQATTVVGAVTTPTTTTTLAPGQSTNSTVPTPSSAVVGAWLAFTAAQVALAAFALRLDGESLRPLWAVPLQQIAYRQLMYLVVIQSVATALAGTRLRWQKLRRLGIVGAPAGVAHRGASLR